MDDAKALLFSFFQASAAPTFAICPFKAYSCIQLSFGNVVLFWKGCCDFLRVFKMCNIFVNKVEYCLKQCKANKLFAVNMCCVLCKECSSIITGNISFKLVQHLPNRLPYYCTLCKICVNQGEPSFEDAKMRVCIYIYISLSLSLNMCIYICVCIYIYTYLYTLILCV